MELDVVANQNRILSGVGLHFEGQPFNELSEDISVDGTFNNNTITSSISGDSGK